jgi:hypothetical protein
MGMVDLISNPFDPNIPWFHVETHFSLSMRADLLRNGVYPNGLAPVNTQPRCFHEHPAAAWGCAWRLTWHRREG